MKLATEVLVFGQDKWIMKNIENSYPHVTKIYILYSKLPWNYNPQARHVYKNSFDINIIKISKYIDKIHIIEGDWLTEESQRNACVDQAKKDGINYLMIHDADEFYFYNDFIKIKQYIVENPNFDVYKCPWHNFWKSFKYLTLNTDGSNIAGYPEIILNLDRNVRFERKRRPTSTYNTIISNVSCFHASYVLTDNELREKLKTWGHHNDFNVDNWYNNIWLKWTPDMKNLHPISPSVWYIASEHKLELPEVLKNVDL